MITYVYFDLDLNALCAIGVQKMTHKTQLQYYIFVMPLGFRCPQLNSLRLSSSKNLTGQAGISTHWIPPTGPKAAKFSAIPEYQIHAYESHQTDDLFLSALQENRRNLLGPRP